MGDGAGQDVVKHYAKSRLCLISTHGGITMNTLNVKGYWNEISGKLKQQFTQPEYWRWKDKPRGESNQGMGWRHCCLVTLFVVSWTLLGIVPAEGQTSETSSETSISNTIGFGAQVGYHNANDADGGSAYLGFLTRIRISSIVGLEGTVGYQTIEQYTFPSPTGEDLNAKVHSIPITASLILYLPSAPNFRPYVVGEICGHYVILDFSQYLNDNSVSDSEKMRFGYHLGFGLELPINDHLALHGDYRYLFVDKTFEQELQYDFSGTKFHAYQIAGGFVVYF